MESAEKKNPRSAGGAALCTDLHIGLDGEGLHQRHAGRSAATVTRVQRTNPLGIIRKPYRGDDVERAVALLP